MLKKEPARLFSGGVSDFRTKEGGTREGGTKEGGTREGGTREGGTLGTLRQRKGNNKNA